MITSRGHCPTIIVPACSAITYLLRQATSSNPGIQLASSREIEKTLQTSRTDCRQYSSPSSHTAQDSQSTAEPEFTRGGENISSSCSTASHDSHYIQIYQYNHKVSCPARSGTSDSCCSVDDIRPAAPLSLSSTSAIVTKVASIPPSPAACPAHFTRASSAFLSPSPSSARWHVQEPAYQTPLNSACSTTSSVQRSRADPSSSNLAESCSTSATSSFIADFVHGIQLSLSSNTSLPACRLTAVHTRPTVSTLATLSTFHAKQSLQSTHFQLLPTASAPLNFNLAALQHSTNATLLRRNLHTRSSCCASSHDPIPPSPSSSSLAVQPPPPSSQVTPRRSALPCTTSHTSITPVLPPTYTAIQLGSHSTATLHPYWPAAVGCFVPTRSCSTLPWSKEADEALAVLHEEPISSNLREILQRDWPADLVEEAVLSSLEKFDGPQLVKLCWAHAVAGVKSPEYFTHMAEALYNQMSHLSITDIANLLWAFSHLKIHHHELFAGLTEFIWESLDIAQCEDLRQICEAFAEVDHYDDDQDLFDGIAQAAVININNFEPWQLCSLLWSFARLQHNSPLLFQVGLEALLPTVDTLDLNSLGQLVAACARMKCDLTPEAMTQLGDRAVHFFDLIAKSRETPTASMALVVWGFAVMGYDSKVLWDNARRAMSHQPVGSLEPDDLARLYFSHLKVVEMRRSGPKGAFNALLPANLLPASFAAWQHSVLAMPQEYVCRTWKIHTEELMHPGKLMQNIKNGLQAIRVDVGKPTVSLCGNFYIPLPIMMEQGIKGAVVVALPHHTTRNEPFQLLGEFQSMMTELELRRWRVVPVMWYEWGQEDADDERQRIYLARQIQTSMKVKL